MFRSIRSVASPKNSSVLQCCQTSRFPHHCPCCCRGRYRCPCVGCGCGCQQGHQLTILSSDHCHCCFGHCCRCRSCCWCCCCCCSGYSDCCCNAGSSRYGCDILWLRLLLLLVPRCHDPHRQSCRRCACFPNCVLEPPKAFPCLHKETRTLFCPATRAILHAVCSTPSLIPYIILAAKAEETPAATSSFCSERSLITYLRSSSYNIHCIDASMEDLMVAEQSEGSKPRLHLLAV